MPKDGKPATPAKSSSPPDAEAAFNAVLKEIEAVESDLATINLDISQVVSHVLGALPGIEEHAEDIGKLVESRHVRNLRSYALAAWYAHLQALPPAKNAIRALIDEATELRNTLVGDAEALARRGYFDPDAVAQVRAGHGHVDLANDLVALATMFTRKASEIAGKTPVTETEIQRARSLAPELLSALGLRDRQDGAKDAFDHRAQAFTLLVRSYDQVQRAVSFLRWSEGDADVIAPSLYKARGARSKAQPVTPVDANENGAGEVAPTPGPVVTEPAPLPVAPPVG